MKKNESKNRNNSGNKDEQKTGNNSGPKNRLLHHNASPATLIFVLKFMFALWFVRFAIDPLQQISYLPVEYSNPTGLLGLLPVPVYTAIHSFAGLCLLRGMIVIACAGVWVPRLRLPSAVTGCVLLMIAGAVTRGFGHINHAEIGPLLVTCILTLFACRLPSESVTRPGHEANKTASTGMILATFVFSMVYALVGIARLGNGGIDVLAGDSITNHLVYMGHHDWLLNYNFSELLLQYPPLLLAMKLGFAAVTIIEIAAPFCLINERVRKIVLIMIPIFHLGVVLMFKVLFIEQPLTLILLINLTPWLAARQARLQQTRLLSQAHSSTPATSQPIA